MLLTDTDFDSSGYYINEDLTCIEKTDIIINTTHKVISFRSINCPYADINIISKLYRIKSTAITIYNILNSTYPIVIESKMLVCYNVTSPESTINSEYILSYGQIHCKEINCTDADLCTVNCNEIYVFDRLKFSNKIYVNSLEAANVSGPNLTVMNECNVSMLKIDELFKFFGTYIDVDDLYATQIIAPNALIEVDTITFFIIDCMTLNAIDIHMFESNLNIKVIEKSNFNE